MCARDIYKALERVLKKAFDARFEIIHRRVDEPDDVHFLIVLQLVIVNDLRRKCREDVRLARARDGGNAQLPACVAEDVLLGGSRDEGRCHVVSCQI